MNETTINVGNVHKYTITNLNPNTLYGFKVQAVYKDGTISSYSNTLLSETKPSVTYSVTYNGNGNTEGLVPVDTLSPYRSGSLVTVLDNTGLLVKTNYVFSGWNTVKNGSGNNYFPGNTFTIILDTILYAQWRSITYSVIYNGNGNTEGLAPVDSLSPYISGSLVTVLRKGAYLVKTGYTFTNWNTIANGTGTSYSPNSQFIITENTILYAQWILIPTS